MKDWLEKIKAMKGTPWLLLLAACAAAFLLLPLSGQPSSGMTEEERRVSATLCRIAGAGETRVSIYYAQESSAFGSALRTPVGAVIVSKGARDLQVRLELMRAAEALLGLSARQVEVFPMEDAP